MTKTISAAVALATVLTFAGAAQARTSRIVVEQLAVPYRTADLTTPQGARALLARVDRVALSMCRGGPASLTHPIRSEIEACRTKAVSRAVAELNAPLVTAAYAERRGATLASR